MELRLLQANIDTEAACGHEKPALDGSHHIGLFVDSETGVEYFVMNSSNAGAICPRLDRDGKPIVYK